jgi:hypothetical protein
VSGFRVELARLLGWKRWLAAIAVMAAAGWGISDQLRADAATGRFGINQWDVVLTALNNVIVMLFIMFPVFIALVGDVAIGDRRGAFASFSLPRVGSRGRWWLSKLGAILVVASLYFLLAVVVLGVIGTLFTRMGWGLSDYGATTPGSGSTLAQLKYYPPPPIASVPAIGVLLEAGYAGLAVSLLTVVVLAIAQIWPRPWTPLTLGIGLSLAIYGMPATSVLHPGLHLFWSLHSYGSSDVAVQWWASALYLAIEAAGAFVLGRAVLRRSDI